ncbi:MAG: DNA-3-methyladenine glycosylase 2 family protein [Tissierellia bacterium]|nr:DNA-3-methyladenine glycosylase 2 family protein [Tissierellia bacterium]
MYFKYGKEEMEYLSNRCEKMTWVIEKTGFIKRETMPELFPSLIQKIVGQQISTAAQVTITKRMREYFGDITPEKLHEATVDEIQKLGMSFRKAGYIKSVTESVMNKEIILEDLYNLEDEEVIKKLSSLKGIGPWTAEMLLAFTMNRPDVLSYGDLGIHRGLQIIYNLEKIDKKKFEEFRKRFSPYGSVASIYIWHVAGGGIPEIQLRDKDVE